MSRINTHAPSRPIGASAAATSPDDQAHRASRNVAIAAATVPVLVLGQFAMLAIIPIGIVVRTTWRQAHLRRMRPWAIGLGTAYAIPLAAWAIGPDRAPSLSKDMAPPLAGLIVAAAITFLARLWSVRRGHRD